MCIRDRGGAGALPCGTPLFVSSLDTDGREGRRLVDRYLTQPAELQQSEKGDRLLDPRKLTQLVLEVETAAPGEQRAKALYELLERRIAERHVGQRDRLGRRGEHTQGAHQRGRILRGNRTLDWRAKRRRAKPEESVLLLLEPACKPGRRLLRAPVGSQPACQLLGRLLGLQLGQLGRLVVEEQARLQLQ